MQQLITIKQKLQQLIKQHQQLQKENLQLKDNAEKNLTTIQQQTLTIQELQKKLDIAQIQQTQLSKQDKQALEKRINNYLKEIDVCLSILNKD